MRSLRVGVGVATTALAISWASVARADGDGIYGRFNGDVALQAHAGAAFAQGGPSLALQLTGVFLSTAGIYVHYTDAVGNGAPTVARSIATGVHVAPLFLIRGALNGEHGPAFVDLLIDSLAFELGAVWTAPNPAPLAPPPRPSPTFDETPGLEAALRLDVPLLAYATGPWIAVRAALRWRPSDFGSTGSSSIFDRGALLSVTLGWHQVFRTHLVDSGDRVSR